LHKHDKLTQCCRAFTLALARLSCFLLVAKSDHTTGSRNIKPEVVFNVQKMARYASFCLIMGPFKGKVSVFARLWPVRTTWHAPRRRLTLASPAISRAARACKPCVNGDTSFQWEVLWLSAFFRDKPGVRPLNRSSRKIA